MRSRDFLIFFSVVFIIYAAANTFLFIKGMVAFNNIIGEGLYAIIFIILALTFLAGKILERRSSSVLIDILNITGGFWLSFMLYSVLLIILADISRGILLAFDIIESGNAEIVRKSSYMLAFMISLVLIIIGFSNTIFTAIRTYKIEIPKTVSLKELRIAAVSDIHLGSVIRRRSMKILSEKLKKISPDIILFLGDIVDGEINPVLRDDLLEALILPESAKHVYAITGNHEYIGGFTKAVDYIESKGIRVLIDEAIEPEDGILLIGRKDRDAKRYTGEDRKKVEELLENIDSRKAIICLDHQPPFRNGKTEKGFDLVLSGHTHNGQMWPLNYLTSKIYKIKYGHALIDGCNYIVSSGFGSWGPRVRLGSRSEVLDIIVSFKN